MGDFDDMDTGLRSMADRIKTERTERLALAKRVFPFGVRYLDAAMGGVWPHDLILIGARTGHGKTGLATVIAQRAAAQGKRVDYFALEGEPTEIERRIKYRALVEIAARGGVNCERFTFQSWQMGALEAQLGRFDEAASSVVEASSSKMRTFYRLREFTATDIEKKFLAIQGETDLIVLDHLHYVDTDDQNENRGYRQVVKILRDVALSIGKPVIVVVHVRKGDRRMKTLLPTLDDFHGTSDIPKIATRAVMIGPAFDQPNSIPHIWNTYIHVAKNRFEGSVARYIALVPYNARQSSYGERFTLGRLKRGTDDQWEEVPAEQIPNWADQKPQPELV